jgi:hypothetical protein
MNLMNRLSIKINILPAILFSLLLSFTSVSAQTFTKRASTPINANSGGYYEYLPEGYSTSTTKYPLIVFVHGINEKGDGSSTQITQITNYGLPKKIKYDQFPKSFTVNGTVYRFIVIAPQFKSWPSSADINAVINYATAKYRVNTAKVYLTGLSMGGAVCWDFGGNTNYNKKIAAMVPIASAGYANSTEAKNIADANIKCWGTHNQYDTWVSSSNTKNSVNNVKTYKIANAKMTLFNSSSHDAWGKTYNAAFEENGLNVFEWMLQYSSGTTTTNQAPVANAGSDKTITLPTTSVTLSGSATDADGTIASYKWTKVSGPNTPVFSSTTSRTPTVTSLIAGTYTLRLTVTDSKGATDYDDVKVIVNTTSTKVEAEKYTNMRGVELGTTTDVGGGQNVIYIDSTDYMEYSINAPVAGTYSFTFRLATPHTGAKFAVRNSGGTTLATVYVPNTGGSQTWTNKTVSVTLPSGTQTLRMYSTSRIRWNFNYFTYALSTTTSGTQAASQAVTEESATAATGLAITPNPFADRFVITVNNTYTGTMRVQLVDVSGVVRKEFQVAKNVAGTVQTYLSAGTLPAGNYFVKLQMANWSQTKQVVKL